MVTHLYPFLNVCSAGGIGLFTIMGLWRFFKHPDIVAPGVNIYATRALIGADSGISTFPNPVNPAWTGSLRS